MPPKAKFTRSEIVSCATELVRREGERALNARRLAEALGSSTQPLFTQFTGMDEIRFAVIEEAQRRFDAFTAERTKDGDVPPYKAIGLAYVAFAAKEKELFRLLYMRDRSGEARPSPASWAAVIEVICRQTGFDRAKAELFHLENWAVVHGIAVMAATGYEALHEALIGRVLTDVYQALVRRFREEREI